MDEEHPYQETVPEGFGNRETHGDDKVALILSGGGARAAYQVGVLKAVGKIIPRHSSNPFQIICGTSAGAINATAIASHASNYQAGIRGMEYVWSHFRADQIYKTHLVDLMKSSGGWLMSLFFKSTDVTRPVSLLNNEPLQDLLSSILRFDKIQLAINSGALHALSITASGYTSGQSVAFYQGQDSIENWDRAHRLGLRTKIGLKHILASSAIPMLFPAVRIHREYFGDGAVRQLAPISPALHLGADKILVIGVSSKNESSGTDERLRNYPSHAQIASHVLNSAFVDSLEGDLERLERVNNTIRAIPNKALEEAEVNLKAVDVMSISPSKSIDEIASRHAHELPPAIRFFLWRSGATSRSGASILSYLLFEQGYCRELIQLGYDDAMAQKDEIKDFFKR